jgi:hypothetical protein
MKNRLAIKIIESLINGNLTDAKNKAKKISIWKFLMAAEEMGYSVDKQVAIAGYLKDNITFGKYCDAMR